MEEENLGRIELMLRSAMRGARSRFNEPDSEDGEVVVLLKTVDSPRKEIKHPEATGSDSSPEEVNILEHKIFNGDIEAGDSSTCNIALGITEGGFTRSMEQAAFWGGISSIHNFPSTHLNRRKISKWDKMGEKDALAVSKIPPKEKELVVTSSDRHNESGNGLKTDTKGVVKLETTTSKKTANFRQRAKIHRVTGIVSYGPQNPKWTAMVCQYLLKEDIGSGVLNRWMERISRDTKCKTTEAAKQARLLMDTILMWSVRKIEEETEDYPEDSDSLESPQDISVESIVEAGARIVSYGPRAAVLADQHICPYCLLFSLSGSACSDVVYGDMKYKDVNDDRLAKVCTSMIAKNNIDSWLEAVAEAHNREQHALNGKNVSADLGCRNRS